MNQSTNTTVNQTRKLTKTKEHNSNNNKVANQANEGQKLTNDNRNQDIVGKIIKNCKMEDNQLLTKPATSKL